MMPPDPGPFANAFDGNAPQLVNMGGGVLATPKVQPIFFANDATMQASVEQFLGQVAGSDYWATTTGEYGVGPLTVQPTIVLADTPPTTDDALQALLAGKFDGTHAEFGAAPDQSTIYAVFLPDGVTMSFPDGSQSCVDFGAYHDEAHTAAKQGIVYSLTPRCHGQGDSDLDEVTISTSHELIEAATDPFVEDTGGFGDADPDHYVWAYTPGAETGDFCEYLPGAYDKLVGDFMVQRTWSNAAATAGKDPCVPALATPYFGAEPMFTESTMIEGLTGTMTTKAAVVAVGESKTIDVVLYSDQPTAAFTVDAQELSQSPELALSWDKTTGKNGDHLKLTIKRVKAGTLPGTEFVIIANDDQGNPRSLWWSFAN